jgi:uncharacterized protein (DUF488 family)
MRTGPAAIPNRKRVRVYDEPMRLLTVGHGTISAEEFVRLLDGAGAARLIDIRSAPGSRHHPHFGRAEMERWLPMAGIAYQWERALGGFRKPSPESPNIALRHPAFRGYADYMLTQEFVAGADELRMLAGGAAVTVMCSESLWWRCHRRLLSDYLMLVQDFDVRHIMHDASLREHRLTEGVRTLGDHVVYDQPPLTVESGIVPTRDFQNPNASYPGREVRADASVTELRS